MLQPRSASEIRGGRSYDGSWNVCVIYLQLVGAHGGRGLIGLLDFDLCASALHILCNLHAILTTLQVFSFVKEVGVLNHHGGMESCKDCEKNVCKG